MGYRSYKSYWGFPEYVPVAEKKAKASKKLKELMNKDPAIKPVVIEGRAIARTWWGKAWNQNLERYADYHNRIGRGRSYVKHGAVLDLRIGSGEVKALVQGSRSKPYSVEIKISALSKEIWSGMRSACEHKLESLEELLAGKFPQALGDVFTAQGEGMFPSPKEIKFSCSCPDWAVMCKHVAAVLYGIGARLDEDPALFFTLRKVAVGELIAQTVVGQAEKLKAKAKTKKAKVLEETELSSVFGIEIDNELLAGAGQPEKKGVKSSAQRKERKKPAKKAKTKKAATPAQKGKKITGKKKSA
jgi:uncharacterized Zn finger protein